MRNETTYDVGESVMCDYCGSDEHNDEHGGLLFGSSAVCPGCQSKTELDINRYNEGHLILDRAKPDETFREFVLRLRGGDNTVRVITGCTLDEILEV